MSHQVPKRLSNNRDKSENLIVELREITRRICKQICLNSTEKIN